MPLSPGTRLGPYEVLGPLGAGGMGEVYRAKDTRLDRSVAIKVLPSHLPSPSSSTGRRRPGSEAWYTVLRPWCCRFSARSVLKAAP